MVFDVNGDALYFSKALIPFVRDAQGGAPTFRHIGLYGYSAAGLARFMDLSPSPLELTEGLEQLRALENGMGIRVVEVDYRGRRHLAIDSPEDLKRVEALLAEDGERRSRSDERHAHELLLVRHGNTFGPGDRVSWVGRGEDLPLVESGRAQARALGATLRAAGWSPTAAVSGALARQTEHLAIATGGAPAPRVDERLDEVDYGAWGGLTTAEIEERFGAESVAAWNERSEVPTGAGWPEDRRDLEAARTPFAADTQPLHSESGYWPARAAAHRRWFLGLMDGVLERATSRRAGSRSARATTGCSSSSLRTAAGASRRGTPPSEALSAALE